MADPAATAGSAAPSPSVPAAAQTADGQLSVALDMFATAQSDEHRFVAMLLVSKTSALGDVAEWESTVLRVHGVVGLVFPLRLLKTPPPEGQPRNFYRAVAVGIVALYTMAPALAASPEILELAPYLFETAEDALAVLSPPTQGDPANPLPQGREESLQRAHEIGALEDALKSIANIALTPEGHSRLVQFGAVRKCARWLVQQPGIHASAFALLVQTLELLVVPPHSELRCSSGDVLAALEAVAHVFAESQSRNKFESGRHLRRMLEALPERYPTGSATMQGVTSSSAAFARSTKKGLLELLKNKIGPAERPDVLRLGSLVLRHCGLPWALGQDDSSASEQKDLFFRLFVDLSCIEVRMLMEEGCVAPALENSEFVCSQFEVIEVVISHLLAADPSEAHWKHMHGSVAGAIAGVLAFFRYCEEEQADITDASTPLVYFLVSCVRVVGAWLSEETGASVEDAAASLPFVMRFVSDDMWLSAPSEIDPLVFLLPALCFLSAEDATRETIAASSLLPSALVARLKKRWLPILQQSPSLPLADGMLAATRAHTRAALDILVNVAIERGSGGAASSSALRDALHLCLESIASRTRFVTPEILGNMAVLALLLLRKQSLQETDVQQLTEVYVVCLSWIAEQLGERGECASDLPLLALQAYTECMALHPCAREAYARCSSAQARFANIARQAGTSSKSVSAGDKKQKEAQGGEGEEPSAEQLVLQFMQLLVRE